MVRPRKDKYKGLPPNLFYDKTNKMFRYRRPDSGKFTPMGKDRMKAVSAARQLNTLLMVGQDLVAKVIGTRCTLSQFIDDRYLSKIIPERNLAQKTLSDYQSKLIYIRKTLGDMPIDEITVKHIADFLGQYPPTASNRYRSLLMNIFKYAVAEGLIDSNPAANTLNRKIIKKRARLNLEQYKIIYYSAEPWVKNAMALALLTLQRREDIVRMKFSDIKDGFLFVVQQKTAKHGSAAHIKIKIGDALTTLIQRCRDSVVSPFIIHNLPPKSAQSKYKEHITQIIPDHLSKKFSQARDTTTLFEGIPGEERPTFHEIRSLGIQLYEKSGIDAQALAGHTDRKMTEKYKEGHEIEWTDAVADLRL